MKRNKTMKRVLSMFLALVMVASMVTVSPFTRKVQAAEVPVWTEDFNDNSSSLLYHVGNATQDIMPGSGSEDPYLKFGTSGWSIIKTPAIAVEAGKTYKLSYQLKLENVVGSMYYYNHYQEMNNGADASSGHYQDYAINANTNGWIPITLEYTPAAGKNQVVFYFEDAGWGGSADIYLDDITLVEITEDKELVNTTLSFDKIQMASYLKITGASSYQMYTPEVAVEEGQTYEISYKLNLSNKNGDVHFWPCMMELGSSANFNTSVAPNSCKITDNTNGWIDQSFSYTVPSGMNRIQIYFEQAWGGTADFCLDSIQIIKAGATTPVYEEDFTTTKQLAVNAGTGTQSHESSSTWYLNGTNLETVTGQYFTATVKLDGQDVKISFEKSGNKLVIQSNPESSFEIPKGTILIQADASNDWADVANGDQLKVEKTFKYKKAPGGSWEPESEPPHETTLSVESADADGNWVFALSKALPEASPEHWNATIKIDGADRKVFIHNASGKLNLYNWSYENGSAAPAHSLEIPEGTIIYQSKATGFWQTEENAARIVITESLHYVKNGSGNWVPYTATPETDLVFEQVTTSGDWKFAPTVALPEGSATHYNATIQIDGVSQKVLFVYEGDGKFWVYQWTFGAQGAVPSTSLEIPNDTVLYEVDANASLWTIVENPRQVVIKEGTKVVKSQLGTWSTYVEPVSVSTNLDLNKVDSNHWYLKPSSSLQNSPLYFTAMVKVDGTEQQINIEYDGSDYVIWSNFFSTAIPTETLEIPAGTIFYEIDTNAGWTVKPGGTEVTIQQGLKAINKGLYGWMADVPPQVTHETAVSYSKINGNDWYFTPLTAFPEVTKDEYYVTKITVDGIERKAVVYNDGTNLIIWEGFFGGELPTTGFELKEGTVLYETNPIVSGWPIISGGICVTITNTLKVKPAGHGLGWRADVPPSSTHETGLNFAKTEGNHWYFAPTVALPPLPQEGVYQYYVTNVKVDGVERKLVIEDNGTDVIIWEGFFGGEVPTTSFELEAGTILYETNPNVLGWPITAGGAQVKITEPLQLTKDETYGWMPCTQPEAVYDITLNYNKVSPDQAWHLTTENTLSKAEDAAYFVGMVKIDGVERKIAFENSAEEQGKLIVWPGFFEIDGGVSPESDFVIPAGTVLYEVDSVKLFILSGGTQITVKNDVKVIKDNVGNWLADVPAEAIYKTKLDLTNMNAQGVWYFSASKQLPSVKQAKLFCASIMIDGVLTKVAFENDGKNLVIWPDFFKVFGGKVPVKQVEIPKGTILYEIHSADWSILAGGTQIVVSDTFKIKNNAEGNWGFAAVSQGPQEEKDTLNFVRLNLMMVEGWQTGEAVQSGSFSNENGILSVTAKSKSNGKTLLSFSQEDLLKLEPGEKYKVIITYKSSVSFGLFMNLKSNAWTEAPGVCEATENGEWITLSATFRATAGDAFNGALIQSWNSGKAHDIQIKEFCISRDDDTIELGKKGTVGKLPDCEGEDDALGRFVYEWVLYTKNGKSIVVTDNMSMDKIRSILGNLGTYYAYERLKCVHHMDDGKDYGKEPTCTEGGWAPYYICRNCQAILSDYLCTVEIADLEEWKAGEGRLEPTGHEDMTEELAIDGTVYYRCKCGKLFELDGETYVEVSESVLNTTNSRADDLTVSQTPDSETNSDIWTVVYITAGVIVVGASTVVILVLRRKSKKSKSV